MRVSLLLLVGVFPLLGCDSIFGISDHAVAASEGGVPPEGSVPVDGSMPPDGGGHDSGSGSETDSSCPVCVLGAASAKLGSCCLGGP